MDDDIGEKGGVHSISQWTMPIKNIDFTTLAMFI